MSQPICVRCFRFWAHLPADVKSVPSVKITGQTSGNPIGGKYELTITSTPVCGLPIFQNCSERKFDPSDDQWAAYSAGDFLTKYLAEKNINSLSSPAAISFRPPTLRT